MYTLNMPLNDHLYKYIMPNDHAHLYPNGIGVEVELEGRHIMGFHNDNWGFAGDGSLRKIAPGDEAIEYVLRGPLPIQMTEIAINSLVRFLKRPNCEVYDSYRTSIHIHLNFVKETYRTIYCMMVLSLVLDELLVSQNGEHRIGNNFCLRSKDALGQVVQLIRSIEEGHGFFNILNNERYSSINFASLLKFGSMEFRSLECTLHEGRIMHWIGTLDHMKQTSKKFIKPTEIIELFSRIGPQEFLRMALGPFAHKYASVPGMATMLHNGMRIAQDVAFCSAWNE